MTIGDGSSAEGAARWRDTGAEAIMAEQIQAHGSWGLVAAAAPHAALIGAETLRAGGNAYDAAVAMALAETVLLPPKCGLGGDLVALVWDAGAPAPKVLLGIGGAPAGLAPVAARGDMGEIGPNSIGVPGAAAGYATLAARGRLTLPRLIDPALRLARRGFAWSRICSVLSEEAKALVAAHNPAGTRYYPGGAIIPPGETVRLPGMALLLETFAEDGARLFEGPVGDAIAARVAAAGGVLTKADLCSARADWAPALAGRLAADTLFVTPAPTHGASLADAVAGLGTVHRPAAAYTQALAAIAKRKAALSGIAGTSMVTAVDNAGTVVLVIHSNSYPRFGSGLIVDEYDLILANRAGRGFSSVPGHPNFPEAGKRPATTLHAWAVARADGTRLIGATPGGANQMTWNAQTLARIAGGETDVGRLIAAPRWEWRPADDGIIVEAGFAPDDRDALAAAAPSFREVDRWAMRSAMQIARIDPDGRASLAVDPRTVGGVIGL